MSLPGHSELPREETLTDGLSPASNYRRRHIFSVICRAPFPTPSTSARTTGHTGTCKTSPEKAISSIVLDRTHQNQWVFFLFKLVEIKTSQDDEHVVQKDPCVICKLAENDYFFLFLQHCLLLNDSQDSATSGCPGNLFSLPQKLWPP